MLPLLLAAALAAAPTPAAPRTLRVDYFHTGTATEERFSLDRVVLEPLPWPGNPRRPVDDTDLGKYLFEVRDEQTKRLVYSRGFASIYGEWELTPEAKEAARTFSESLRFPAPEAPVLVTLKKRGERNAWREVWTVRVDPRDMFVDPSVPDSPGPLLALQRSGPSADKVDLLILGDGYTQRERKKFERDARRLVDILFTYSPFKEQRDQFNVWGLMPPSRESGISRPSTGQHRRSRVGATYDAFGSERYVLTFENRMFRDVAAFAPYEFVEILVNGQTYGGGGIFGLYSTVASDSLWAPYVFVHEFGHHFAGLADEYYTSDPTFVPAPEQRPEPWERNVTANGSAPKWKAQVTAGTPLPTPWDKAAYEQHAQGILERRRAIRKANRPEKEMDALFLEQRAWEEQFLGGQRHARAVGAFEGANYEAQGYFRPEVDCVMFTRDRVPFCRVCQAALLDVIRLYTAGPAAAR